MAKLLTAVDPGQPKPLPISSAFLLWRIELGVTYACLRSPPQPRLKSWKTEQDLRDTHGVT